MNTNALRRSYSKYDTRDVDCLDSINCIIKLKVTESREGKEMLNYSHVYFEFDGEILFLITCDQSAYSITLGSLPAFPLNNGPQ